MKKIAVIGTGIMGSGIVSNYLKNDYEVIIWNRTPEKTKTLQELGAKLVDTPRAAAKLSDIIFEVTANDESSQAVWQGPNGILAGSDNTKTLIASATLSIDWTEQLYGLCKARELNFFDIPLTGGRIAAESGSLTLLIGGDVTKLDALMPDLKPISSKQFYFGKNGSGMKYKLILNSLQAAHMAAFGEAMLLATKQGLDANVVGPALCDRPGGAPTLIGWGAYQADPIPLSFSVDWITKDLNYAHQMDNTNNYPIFNDTLAVFRKAQTAGFGAQDWGIVTKNNLTDK
jgi:3-hydroxyisobutyrate dehydrogenase-like beta-hydroxyacid dehydrogenase